MCINFRAPALAPRPTSGSVTRPIGAGADSASAARRSDTSRDRYETASPLPFPSSLSTPGKDTSSKVEVNEKVGFTIKSTANRSRGDEMTKAMVSQRAWKPGP